MSELIDREPALPGSTQPLMAYEKSLWIVLALTVAAVAWLQAVAASTQFAANELETVSEAVVGTDPVGPVLPDPEHSIVVASVVVFLLISGAVLLAAAVYARSQGRLPFAYHAREIDRTPYLETLLLFVVGAQVVGASAGLLSQAVGQLWPLWLNLILLLVPFWPLLRGVPRAEWRCRIGWQPIAAPWREAGLGLVAYIASLPVLWLGLMLSLVVSRWTGAAYHPVVDWMTRDHWIDLVTIVGIAVLWAPVVEETVFRGAFQHYLRGRLGIAASGICGGLFFAALHPQGLAGLPFLVTLGTVLAYVREWRGSILACVAMHFIHNGITLILMAALMK